MSQVATTPYSSEIEIRLGETKASSRPANHSGRVVLVDFARVLAILFMIQGHSLDVLLAPAYRQGTAFNTWLFLRGLTAPMFFTLSGVSFTIASLRRWDKYSRLSPALFKRLGRFAFFVFLGYVMHWPARTVPDLRRLNLAAWQAWLQVDVLQCIGMTLILLQIALAVARAPRRFAAIAGGASACVLLATPLVWSAHAVQKLPLSVASFFTAHTGSLFPLFPWSGYVFFGAMVGYLYSRWHETSPRSVVWPLAAAGAIMFFSGLIFYALPIRIYGAIDFWRTSPDVFLLRAGCVCILLALLSLALRAVRIPELATRSLAQESLSIYFVHNAFLYGSIWNRGLRQVVGASLTPLPTLLWITLMIGCMVLLGWSWNWFKKNDPYTSTLFRATLFVAAAYSLM